MDCSGELKPSQIAETDVSRVATLCSGFVVNESIQIGKEFFTDWAIHVSFTHVVTVLLSAYPLTAGCTDLIHARFL